jgi:SAM-dependent methyltransferase
LAVSFSTARAPRKYNDHVKLAEYPSWLENWWIDRACRHYAVPKLEDCAGELRSAIQRLSDSFKVNHKFQFPDYQRDPELILAYGLFYFPQSFIRIQFPLMETLARGWTPPSDRAIRILDLGCGVGAAGFGAVSMLRPHRMEGWALDHSQEALQIHAELSGSESLGTWHHLRFELQEQRISGLQKMDLILLSFTLTEMASEFERTMDFWLRRLHPNGALLVLEPFSKPGKRRLEHYRDRLSAEKRYRVVAPSSASGPSSLSSHKMRTWNLPESMLLLNKHLNRIIDELNFNFLAITSEVPLPPPADAGNFVLINPFVRTKGKWTASGRSSDGLDHAYEILARHVTPEMKRKLQKLKRGDSVHVSHVQVAGTSLRFENLED